MFHKQDFMLLFGTIIYYICVSSEGSGEMGVQAHKSLPWPLMHG